MKLLALAMTFFVSTLFFSPNMTAEDKNPQYEITVTEEGTGELGKIVIELYPKLAPKHCQNFDKLVESGFYDGTAFHRVIPDFMIQGGDPNSKSQKKEMWGMGSPDQETVPAEFNTGISHVKGVVSAARSNDPNSATSQFFICHGNPTFLDGQYSSYGKVVKGIEVVDKVAKAPRDKRDNPNKKISMKIVKLK